MTQWIPRNRFTFLLHSERNHQIWSTNEKSIHVSTFQYGSKIQIKEIVQKVMNNSSTFGADRWDPHVSRTSVRAPTGGTRMLAAHQYVR